MGAKSVTAEEGEVTPAKELERLVKEVRLIPNHLYCCVHVLPVHPINCIDC